MSEAVYLLTGASGLLGGSILTALLDEGARVRVLVRDPSRVSIEPRRHRHPRCDLGSA